MALVLVIAFAGLVAIDMIVRHRRSRRSRRTPAHAEQTVVIDLTKR